MTYETYIYIYDLFTKPPLHFLQARLTRKVPGSSSEAVFLEVFSVYLLNFFQPRLTRKVRGSSSEATFWGLTQGRA